MSSPICPKHNRPARFGPYGWSCSAQGPANTPGYNAKGYCTQKFLDPPPDQQATSEAQPTQPTAPTSTALALPVEDRFPKFIAEQIQRFASNPNFDLLLPSVPINMEPNPLYRLEFSVVQLDLEADAFPSGYKNNAPTFSLGKTGLDKLADACAISFDDLRRMDDRTNPDFCEYQVTGVMRTASGEERRAPGLGAIDMKAVDADEWGIRVANNAKKAADKQTPEPILRAEHEKAMRNYRRYMERRARTAAREDAIRVLLSMRGGMTAAQIVKPKVVMRVSPNLNDPGMRQAAINAGNNANRLLFGGSSQAREIPADIDDSFPTETMDLGDAPMEDA